MYVGIILRTLSYFCSVKNIYKHIETLLAHHDYAVLPNFGGFVVQQQSAKIVGNKIIAPRCTIAFNQLMHHSDGLLAIEIARTEGISYKSAAEKIENEVECIKNQLEKNGHFALGNLGEISKTKTGLLHFTPHTNIDFLPRNIGIHNITMSEKLNSIKSNNNITFTIQPYKIYKYAAAAVLIIGLLIISPQVNDVKHSNSANLSSLLIEKKLVKRVAVKENVAINTTADSIEKSSINTPSSTETAIKDETQAFHVIVASWQAEETATTYCQELAQEKYTNAHVVSPKKIHHVAIQSFTDKQKAVDFMNALRKANPKFKSAWVLCENNSNS